MAAMKVTGPRRLLAPVVLAATAAAAALTPSCSRERPAQAAPSVAVARTVRTHLAISMTLQGEFHPYQDILVYAKVSGYVKAIPVDIGDRVKAGELIATLEVPELQDQLAAAEAAERHAQSENAIAHLDYQRLVGVNQARPNLIAQQDLDDAEAKDTASAASVALARAEAARYRSLADYTRITAPFSGVITKRFADLGSLIQAGTSSGTMPLVELAEDDRLRLRFPVPEAETPLIGRHLAVTCTVDALHRSFQGAITRDTWDIDRSTRTMIAEVDLPNPGGDLKAGMYATVLLPLQAAPNALAVPLQALSAGDPPTVMVVGADGTLAERSVAVGMRTATQAEISSGLNEGDLVVVGDRGGLHPGDRASPSITETQTPP
jgi:RND family efflux transporter MFP subunit